MNRLGGIAVALVLFGACVADDDVAASERPLVDGTPDAIGLLSMLNDQSTTLDVLDHEVPLDVRAATNLIGHRDGPDAVYGTADDDPFDTIAEVDDIKWVGPVSIERMIEFAAARGFVPGGDDYLGTYDGVSFTVAEAERVLAAVNELPEDALRYEVPLDVRAVDSIMAARPILSMPELADLYWIGPAMMQRLEAFVAAADERADCQSTADCPGDQLCTGKPFDGSSDYGMCYDPSIPPGAWEPCSPTEPCGQDLACLGELAWGEGFCVPGWQQGSFDNAEVHAIPASGEVVTTSVVVRGLATVPIDIAVHHGITHSDPQALRVTLRSVNGDEAVLWDGPGEDGPMPATLIHTCCIPGDDYVNGRWWLEIDNLGNTGTGTIDGWTLQITSQWD